MRRTVPLVITFLTGIFMLSFRFFHEESAPAVIAGKMQEWGLILGAFAVVLGTGNILRVSWHKMRRGEDRIYKVVLLVGLFGTMLLGLLLGVDEKIRANWFTNLIGVAPPEAAAPGTGDANPFFWIYFNILLPLGATMFSLLVFYITSAAYRAFRMRSFEATLLLITAVIVMLGQVPVGIPLVGDLKDWIMEVPNVAGKRAILMGAAMGIAAMSLRVILGIERSYLGGD